MYYASTSIHSPLSYKVRISILTGGRRVPAHVGNCFCRVYLTEQYKMYKLQTEIKKMNIAGFVLTCGTGVWVLGSVARELSGSSRKIRAGGFQPGMAQWRGYDAGSRRADGE